MMDPYKVEGLPVEACRSCGAPIVWIKTKAGKSMPVNADGLLVGTSHFASCPQAKNWRKK